MDTNLKVLNQALAATLLATLAACGGGGSGGGGFALPVAGTASTSGSTSTNTTAPSLVLSGTAATGAALANANVSITDTSGNSPCQETSITTTALGSYTCTLKSGATAPFFVVVTDPTGNSAPLVSVATTTPAAGTPLTVNATPLTTAILAQLSSDGNPLTLVNSKTIDTTALAQATTNIVAQLANVLSAIGAPAGYNPFSTSITAATAAGTGNTADMLLDVVKIVTDPSTGKLAFATVDNPTPIVLATATTTGTIAPTPATSVTTLSKGAQVVAQSFASCFALPTAQRVLGTNTATPESQGGPAVTSAAAACQTLAADAGNAAGVNFLHNGYSASQLFYGLLTSDTMTGAQFSVPEITAFYPASGTNSGADEALLNIRFIDANGNPGNVSTIARSIANTSSSAHPTEWWLVGNQQPVDVTIKLNIRRVQQLNASNTSKFSTFQNGFQATVNAKGPGSIVNGQSLSYARISGPGLPGNGAAGTGLVFIAPVQAGQKNMDLSNKTGAISGSYQCGNTAQTTAPTYNCPNYWFARTKGITGADATTVTSNPSGLVWASAADNLDTTQFVKGAKYKIELFHGTNTTPTYTYRKTLTTDLVPIAQAVNLPWNTLGTQSLSALDPAGALAGAQQTVTVDWVQNISAQQVGNIQMNSDASGSYGQSLSVSRGATSIVWNANGANPPVPAFDTTKLRTILLGYRMLDGSNKTAVYTYN